MFNYVMLVSALMMFMSSLLLFGAAGAGGASISSEVCERGTIIPLELPDKLVNYEQVVSHDHSLIVSYHADIHGDDSRDLYLFSAMTGRQLA